MNIRALFLLTPLILHGALVKVEVSERSPILAGKTFGPLGFIYSAWTGALPWSFGWINVFNDVIWLPVFWRFALAHARVRSR